MRDWWRKLTGQVCCPRQDGKNEWTPWEKKESEYERPVNADDGNLYATGRATCTVVRIYQERICATCGKIFQEKLRY